MKLYAALLSGDDPEPGPKGLDQAMAQMGLLRGTLSRAWEAMKKEGADQPGGQSVFVAPEFWFSNRFHAEAKFYGEDIKKWIVDGLEATGKEYPAVLIIPGTVLWCMKRRPGGVHVQKVKQRYEAISKYHSQTYSTKVEPKYTDEYSAQNLQFYGTAQTNAKDWTHSFPEPSNPVPGKPLPESWGPADLLESFDNYVIGANTAYISKGGRILKYHKMGNSAETSGFAHNIVFMPGNIVGQFYVGSVRYGLEICMDHWLGVLKNSNSPAVDVQIITSNQTENRQFNHNAKGVVLHSTNRGIGGGYSTAFAAPNTQVIKSERLATYANRLALDLVIYDLGEIGAGAGPGDLLKPVGVEEQSPFPLSINLPRIR